MLGQKLICQTAFQLLQTIFLLKIKPRVPVLLTPLGEAVHYVRPTEFLNDVKMDRVNIDCENIRKRIDGSVLTKYELYFSDQKIFNPEGYRVLPSDSEAHNFIYRKLFFNSIRTDFRPPYKDKFSLK